MNRLTAKAIIAELAQSDHRCAAIVTENPRQVVDTFRELPADWAAAIASIRVGSGFPTIRFAATAGANMLYVIDEQTARRTALLRGQLLAFVYLDYLLSPSSDFYRELAARTEEIIQA